MKHSDVPQDDNRYFRGQRKAVYAVNDKGDYGVVPSSGWQVEEIATGFAVNDFRELAVAAHARAASGETSPLDYHMYANRMDLPTLADTVGVMRWRVKRHLRPEVYAKLGEDWLQRYADAMGVAVSTLRELPDEPQPL